MLDVETNNPRVTLDASRGVARTCSGVQIPRTTADDIDTRRHRLRPSLVLSDYSRHSLGVFMFGNDVRSRLSWGIQWKPDLFDESFILGQALARTFSVPKGGSILTAIAKLYGDVGFSTISVGVADQATRTPLIYAGGSLRSDAINALAALLGSYPPYFNNDGIPTLRPVAVTGAPVDHVYEDNTHVIEGFTETTGSWYKAPNRYIVTGNDVNASIIGVYDIPAIAPNSYANTGVVVTNVTPMQGVASQAIADTIAYGEALIDTTSYLQGTFQSTVDSRHDVYDLVQLYGQRYQETGWDIACTVGGTMTHNLTGIYG